MEKKVKIKIFPITVICVCMVFSGITADSYVDKVVFFIICGLTSFALFGLDLLFYMKMKQLQFKLDFISRYVEVELSRARAIYESLDEEDKFKMKRCLILYGKQLEKVLYESI